MRELVLSEEQKRELETVAAHHRLPYMREKARALLFVNRGIPGNRVGRDYCIPQRCSDTIYDWMDRYTSQGSAGLLVQPGRGRKPAFSPSAPNGGSCARSIA